MVTTSYTDARARLAELLDRVTQDRETVIITRRNADPVALIAADELESMRETLYLLRSPANADRLLTSLERARTRTQAPSSVAAVRAEFGLAAE